MKEERVVEGRLGRSPAALARGWPGSRDNRASRVQEDFLQIGCEGATGGGLEGGVSWGASWGGDGAPCGHYKPGG